MFPTVILKRTLVFTTIISSNTFQLSTSFSFNSGMEILKDIKHVIFGFQTSSLNFPGVIINKTNKVQCTSKRLINHRAKHQYELNQEYVIFYVKMIFEMQLYIVYQINNEYMCSSSYLLMEGNSSWQGCQGLSHSNVQAAYAINQQSNLQLHWPPLWSPWLVTCKDPSSSLYPWGESWYIHEWPSMTYIEPL